MQKLSDLIDQLSGVDEAYGELLSQPEVMAILAEHEAAIDMRTLPSFINALDEFVKGTRKCQDCTGLSMCRQPIRGHFPTLEPHLGRLKLGFAPCQYFKRQQHLNHIQTFHMPKSMTHANFETMYAEANREELFRLGLDFVLHYKKETYKKGLFLYGSMGSGKTYAICAIANELAKRGIGCAVVYFPELIAQIKASFGTNGSPGDTTVEKLKDVPVLMLDDIGSESVTSWMRDEVLGRILNHRMMHELPTFFTSNFNFEQLQAHYEQTTRNEYEPVKAARILERIKALATPVELVGRNYRDEL